MHTPGSVWERWCLQEIIHQQEADIVSSLIHYWIQHLTSSLGYGRTAEGGAGWRKSVTGGMS